MDVYIKGLGNISPQNTADNSQFLEEIVEYNQNNLQVIHPVYKDHINPIRLRRMSRMIKMGIAAASICLDDAGLTDPGAIITGTGFGCTGDTEKFLLAMIANAEQHLTPTAFMQSTHNTISGQIAIMLNCNNYNSTYVNRGTSFEAAFQDAMMLIEEGEANDALIGGFDECTDNHYIITSRLGYWKERDIKNTDLYTAGSKGSISGEGASFFAISKDSGNNSYAKIKAVSHFYKPDGFEDVEKRILSFLEANGHSPGSVDLVVNGLNGDEEGDRVYHQLMSGMLKNCTHTRYKHLCGEYDVSSAFALWLASKILKTQTVPKSVRVENAPEGQIKTVLVYNHFNFSYQGLFLLESC